ncbi:GntR family transcriptional regulator/MocR family aminotransferase [Rhizobium sp. BK275]|uniref:MocR-like pyridoxine biosynthesis transcription factor PdxR n=1 Tax=Rhizobium sp. BK275 TaxID=2587077 RepID=UPI00161AAF57|nr:PLP-dependent aminotransferase family protein [Rhizobium sp. BK275]MBB3392884.1 GntR family transcriptional regulator/MocR family aminotransferase [Rhizobium sp. BK275]
MTLTRRREAPSASFRPDLDPSSSAPLPRQLYLSLRNAVAEGRLAAGQRLLSTRLASAEWGISRGVIAEAYEILMSEGFAVARHGSGTYIASSVPEGATRIDPSDAASAQTIRRSVSAAAINILTRGPSLEPQKALPFVTGRIAHDERTARLLNRIAAGHMNYAFEGYGDIQGDLRLRAAISAHLAVSRGVRCSPDQIFITAGTQQALDLAFRVLMTPGDTAVVEDPCYPPARQCLVLNGIDVVGLPVDADGIDISRLLGGTLPPPAAFYVTPSNQYPVGSVLSLSRRLGLLSYAEENDCWIIEDDYDSEFRYQGHPIASLHGLDKANRVLYTGTFSKALLPSLRIGYLVVPADLVPAFRAVRPAVDRCPPSFQQRVIADFLEEGYFPAHLRRLRERLRASRDMLAGFLGERLAEHLAVLLPDQGINLTVRSTGGWDDDTVVSAAALRKGVVVMPLSRMNVVSTDRSRLLLGFSGLSEEEADMGTRVLAEVFAGGTFLTVR